MARTANSLKRTFQTRLCEFNESYEASGEVPSVDQLRMGAIELAAAGEFGGYAFFALDPGETPTGNALDPHTVLTDWRPIDVRRLLATAIFDEASFGRVKFHHRAIREFLAAQWVANHLAIGVPLQRMQGLFEARPFGHSVLIPARRASLSWLAAINVTAREWVVREFPEILFFEGDPLSWDGISADKALANFIDTAKRGGRIRWFNSASEFMRVGRALSAKRVAGALADDSIPPRVRIMFFAIARHAKLADCALVSFTAYRNPTAPAWTRTHALDVLEFVGTPTQRQEVLADLKTGLLNTNELIAHALPVTDWKHLTEEELSAILGATHSETEFGSGPMARVVKDDLLPAADLPSALLVLGAVLASLPRPGPGKRFARFPKSDLPERAWLLDVLPDCYERVLALLPQTIESYPSVCIEAAERIEAQRYSGFADREELNRLHQAIAQHSELRWNIALAIAQSEDIQASVSRLTWDAHCLVNLDSADSPELTKRANDPVRAADERAIWFAVAVAVALSRRHRRERASALRALIIDGTDSAHCLLVRNEYARLRNGAKHIREWKVQERERKVAAIGAREQKRSQLLANLAHIRDGTDTDSLQYLLNHSFRVSGQREYSNVYFEAIATSLHPEIAVAFEEGLKSYWPTISPPNPSDYANGSVPWIALIAVAGLATSLRDPGSISNLSPIDVGKASQLAVWELNGPPVWFEALARLHPAAVETALAPWIATEAKSASPGNGVRGALDMALRCAPDIRRVLLSNLVPLVTSGEIGRNETLKTVVIALAKDGVLSQAMVGTLCQNKLTSSIGSDGRLGEIAWLRIWIDEDATAAWCWFLGHVQRMTDQVGAEVSAFAETVGDMKWLPPILNQEAADVLLGMYSLVTAHPPTTTVPPDSSFFGPPSKRLREAISNVLLGTRGHIGHSALVALLSAVTDQGEHDWISELITQHAELDAAQAANRTSDGLKSIGSPFLSAPCTESQLYEQVIARLDEIRRNLEEGPFSERDLFQPGMPEQFLQLWLAEKFRETQNRRFDVHREEEVDDDKRTDIQLSCPAGNVCVEIKPVDASRGYSANSLRDTLQSQIVGQYLRGTNSSRGILVLMQLDCKSWDIPGDAARQPFDALVKYLEAQAASIKRSSSGVNELTVFGIRCVI